MNLEKFINRPVLSTVISILIVILGILGVATLPITQYPDIAPPTVSVSASYQGANAQTVLNSVIAPLEEEINGVENMTYITSTATNTGDATINVYFKPGSDPDMAAVNVQNRVAKAQGFLPSEVTRAGVITSKRQSSILLAITIYSSDDRYDETFLYNYMKINVAPQIKRVSGVGDVNVLGAEYSMRIWLKPDVMAQYSLMPSDIQALLNDQNIEAAPGQLGENAKDQSFQYILKYKGRLQTPEEFGDMVLRANSNGDVLRLRDVADIELGALSYSVTSRSNGHPGVTTMVFQTAGSNATQIINETTKLIEQESKSFPPGVKYDLLLNTNDFLYASIHEVLKTLIEAFILVFLVVYVFLQDFRSTLIPAIAIPVALIGTFFVLKIIGFSINLLTLCALVLAIAIVVDDAIVVVEAVHAKLDQGAKSARKASIDAMKEISGAIVSITLVMMAVFIPVSFMTGITGTFYRQFGLTMAIAIGISAVNALTLSPSLCALFLKPHDKEGKKSSFMDRFHTAFNAAYDVTLRKYKRGVSYFVKRRVLVFGSIIAGTALLVYLLNTTPTGLVPNEDTGTIFISVDMPPGTSLEKTKETLDKVSKLVEANPAIRSYTEISGYSILNSASGSSYGSFICKLKDWDERDESQSADAVNAQLYMQARELIKDGRVLTFSMPMITGYSISNGFELNLEDKTGGSLEDFYTVAQNFLAKLTERPEISSAQTSFNPSFPQYLVEIDAAKCKQAGIQPSDILSALQGYYGGIYASNFNRFGKLFRVMIQARPDSRTDEESLNSIKIRNGDKMAPITQFVNLKRVYGPDNIKRFNLFTAMLVNGTPAEGYSSGEAIQAIKEVAAETLPQGYGYEFSGMTREEQNQSGGGLGIILVLCIVFVYLLLSAQYESYILPLVVMLSIPFGLAGTFIFARMMGIDNNIYLQIALIMLIGLLAKNSILITEFALDRRKSGMTLVAAAMSGASARLRPILMTSLAMIIGLLPMMFAHGVGANGNRALGAGAIGGMLIGMICQIFVVPALFVVFEAIQERFTPMEWDDLDNTSVKGEIEQYTKQTKR